MNFFFATIISGVLRYSQLTEFNLWLISVGIEERVVVFELNPVIKSLNVTKATVVFSLAVINELMYLHMLVYHQQDK